MEAKFISDRLYYRPYEEKDVPKMVKLRNESSMRKWFYFQEPYCLTIEFGQEEFEKNVSTWNKKIDILKDECTLAVVLNESDELIGNIGIAWRIRPEVKLDGLEIGYSIGEAHQRQGYATEAVKAVIKWAFYELKKLKMEPKIEAYIEHENIPSIRVAEKAGMKFIRKEKYVSVYEIKG